MDTMAYARMWHCLVPSKHMACWHWKISTPGTRLFFYATGELKLLWLQAMALCRIKRWMANDEPICDLYAFYIQNDKQTNERTKWVNDSISSRENMQPKHFSRLLDLVILSAIVIGVRMSWMRLVMVVGYSECARFASNRISVQSVSQSSAIMWHAFDRGVWRSVGENNRIANAFELALQFFFAKRVTVW